jgi:predicted SprT family Zn-dependent metalloprotease
MEIERAKELALELMTQHKLYGWGLSFNQSNFGFGKCSYRKKRIFLSRVLVSLNEEERVRNTILHEIAHALMGKQAGHSSIWVQKAQEIGCTGTRCYSNDTIVPKRLYKGTCPACGKFVTKNKQKNCSCPWCSSVYNPAFRLVWTSNT